jgi:G6PDH family F420-dependent oxidoreductase
MTAFGYTLMGEEHSPKELVDIARRAEAAGFEFLVASDHYHPWVPEQRHSPYTWSVLGAVATVTERIDLATMVTCPIIRYHPAIVAQKAATVALLSDGRFTLGVGAGERLNEHVVGAPWPAVEVRHEMLREAVEIMRLLWTGGYHTYRGSYFTAEDAQVFDLPPTPVPIAVAASGEQSARLAAEIGDALIGIDPEPGIVETFHGAGGTGAAWTQVALCWAEDEDRAIDIAHGRFRWSPLGWKVMSELPNPVNFDAAATPVTRELVAERIPHGPKASTYVDAIERFVDAGYEKVALLQIGDDQEGFFRFWEDELGPRLGAR